MLKAVAAAKKLGSIGLDEIWSIIFNTVLIATVDERDYIIRG